MNDAITVISWHTRRIFKFIKVENLSSMSWVKIHSYHHWHIVGFYDDEGERNSKANKDICLEALDVVL